MFVATDIAGSTEAAQLGEVAFHAAQLEHDAILRRGLAKHGGLELATEGDAFFAAFDRRRPGRARSRALRGLGFLKATKSCATRVEARRRAQRRLGSSTAPT